MALHKPEHKTLKYWLICLVSYPFFPFVWLICLAIFGYDWTRKSWLRDWENYIDDPVDYAKEWLHCRRIPFTDYQINISCIMNHRETSWDIIRKHGDYPNCHEDGK